MTHPQKTLQPSSQPPWVTPVCLAVLLVVAFLPRLALLTARPCLTTEEAFSWQLARQPSMARLIRMSGDDTHPPLYYASVWIWLRAFGATEPALRSLSLLCGLATILATYWVAKVWVDCQDGSRASFAPLLAALFVAVSVPEIAVADYARWYALLGFLALVSAGTLLNGFRRPQRSRWWVLYVVSTTSLLYTHNYGILFVAGQALWAMLVLARNRSNTDWRRQFYSAFISFGVVGLLYLPWLGYLRAQVHRVATDYWISPVGWQDSAALVVQMVSVPIGWPLGRSGYDWWVIAFAVLATAGLVWPWRRRPAEAHFCCILLAHAAAVIMAQHCLGRSIFAPRYLIYLIPFAVVPLAYWLGRVRSVGCRVTATGGVLLTLACLGFQACIVHFGAPRNWRQAADFLKDQCSPNDQILCTDLGQYLDAQYYLRDSDLRDRCWVYNPSLEFARQQHVNYSAGIPAEAIVRPAALKVAPKSRIWVIAGGTPGLSSDEQLPDDWSEIAHRDFLPSRWPFEGAVFLRCYTLTETEEN